MRPKPDDPGSGGDFVRLFDDHAKAVYNFCFRRCGDWALAEDLTAMAFLEAWRRHAKATVAPDRRRAWLLGIATNVLRNQRRAARRHRAMLERLAPGLERDFAPDAQARLDDAAATRKLLALAEGLPRCDLEPLALHVWGELTYDEVAAALGIPVGTVRSRIHRAKRRLRRVALEAGDPALIADFAAELSR